MTQYMFNPADYKFEWTESWYTWNAEEARKQALKARNDKAKELKAGGKKVRKFSLKDQLITRGGIGSGHPEISLVVNCYGVNVLGYPKK